MRAYVKKALRRIFKREQSQVSGTYHKTLFRNDDVSYDTNLKHFRDFCEVFHKAGFIQLHGINLYGRTNYNYLIGGVPAVYDSIDPKDIHTYEIMRNVSVDYIGDNKALIEYLNSIPDEIALHGLYHSDYSLMTRKQQEEDIKMGLQLLHELFPNKEISVFIPPFNKFNSDTEEICKSHGLTICAEEGDHLEDMIAGNRGPIIRNQLYRYHHHRFYPETTFPYYDLSLEKLEEYFRKNAYTYNADTARYRPSLELLSATVKRHEAQQWYVYAYSDFQGRKHAYYPYEWISKNVSKDSKILEVACGAGGMLYHLYADGFSHLSGYDYDIKSVETAQEICTRMNNHINIFQEDAVKPEFSDCYDIMVWTNGMYHLDEYSLDAFYDKHVRRLNDGGYFIFDMVDDTYNSVPNNEYSTKDWDDSIPNEKKRPSEYKIRMSKNEVEKCGKKYNLVLVKYYKINDTIPRSVYIFKRKKPRICILCDKRGWAYDHRASNIIDNLSDEFSFEKVFVVEQPNLSPKNYDILHVCFWGENIYKQFKVPKNQIFKEITSHRWQYDDGYGHPTPKEFADRFLADANTISTQSNILYDILKDACEHIYFCPQGFPPHLFKYTDERIGEMKICMAGNISDPVKGIQDILIPAADGYVLNFATDLQYEDLCAFYNANDVYAVTSLHEGNPQPLLEAMACGCFPVCTRVGNVPELVRHLDNGYIVEERTPEAFAEAFKWCAERLEYVREKGKQNADEVYRIRRWEIMKENYRNIYRDHLERANIR